MQLKRVNQSKRSRVNSAYENPKTRKPQKRKNQQTIIKDFIACFRYGYGIGHFQNDAIAVSCAKTMGTNQINKYERYEIIPAAFFSYLKRKKAIQEDAWLPERQRTVHALLDLLSDAPNRQPGVYSEGEALRDALLLEMFPELKKAMGSSQQVWHAVERYGKLDGLNCRGGTNKLPDYLEES